MRLTYSRLNCFGVATLGAFVAMALATSIALLIFVLTGSMMGGICTFTIICVPVTMYMGALLRDELETALPYEFLWEKEKALQERGLALQEMAQRASSNVIQL